MWNDPRLYFRLLLSSAFVWVQVASATVPTAAQPAGASSQLQEVQTHLERANRAFAALDRQLDRSLFEIDALVDRLGGEPQVLFEFVRDEIRFEPYYGALRGARGALIGRAGNSLDRSLLLASMLSRQGFETEIAVSRLDLETAMRLAERVLEPTKPAPPALADHEAALEEALAILGVDPEEPRARMAALEAEGRQAQARVRQEVEANAAHLTALLAEAGVELADAVEPAALADRVQEHFWVRYRDSGGQWIDLDTSFADAEPSWRPVEAATHHAPNALPDELFHRLGVRVVLQVQRGGEEAEDVLLDHAFALAGRFGLPMLIANLPHPVPDLLAADGDVAEALGPVKEFGPVLMDGDGIEIGKFFDLSGRVFNSPPGTDAGTAERLRASGEEGWGGATRTLESLFGASSSPPPDRILAVFAEYRIESPAGPGAEPAVRNYRRDLVRKIESEDLSEESLKARLFWSAELLPTTTEATADYLGHLQVKSFLGMGPLFEQVLNQVAGTMVETGDLPISPQPPIAALALAAAAQAFRGLISSRSTGVVGMIDRPGLIAFENRFAEGSNGEPTLMQGYDIVASGARFVREPASAASTEMSPHLIVGLIETELEHLLINKRLEYISGDSAPSALRSAAATLAAARDQGIDMRVIASGNSSAALEALDVPAVVKSDLEAALAAGDTIVVPVQLVAIGGRPTAAWWRVGHGGAEIVGMLEGGRGQTTSEKIVGFAALTWPFFLGFPVSTLQCTGLDLNKISNAKGFGCMMAGVLTGLGLFFGWLSLPFLFGGSALAGLGFGLAVVGQAVSSFTWVE